MALANKEERAKTSEFVQIAIKDSIKIIEKATNHKELPIFAVSAISTTIKMMTIGKSNDHMHALTYMLAEEFFTAYAQNHTDDFEIMQARLIENLWALHRRTRKEME